ncbi:hypothetical protein HYQ19_gp084 [Arthrobacter phage DrYang]|uniref:Uncharacterized protein n=1 Tax=Arthrobacter phage DrYang TaxID=2686080 RepID=A0A6B9JC18_9CAUD|nr:hypothetical protein HYQ19_gp084 [Arthrobacter phage DrYang]QGZ17183.1 hypothetical protein SEA_DRYANG_84 [Arthrobacter phage DrYang]
MTENLDPANAPLNPAPVTLPENGDVVLYLTKTDGAEVPAMVNAVFPEHGRVSLRIFNPQHVAEDPIDAEQLVIPDAVTYLPSGSGLPEPGRWRHRD